MLETNVRPKVLTDMLLLLGRFEFKKMVISLLRIQANTRMHIVPPTGHHSTP